MNRNTTKNNSACPAKGEGYAILETLFYISLFAIFSITIINSMIMMTKAFKETTIQAELAQGGNILERISREIRNAYGINALAANSLKLNTTDEAGANKTVEFSLSASNARLLENDVFTGNMNTQNISVVDLSFTQLTTANGLAVKMFLSVRSNRDLQNRTANFYDTVVLRGSY